MKVTYSGAGIEYIYSPESPYECTLSQIMELDFEQNNYGYSFSYGPFILTDKIMDHKRGSLLYPKHRLYM